MCAVSRKPVCCFEGAYKPTVSTPLPCWLQRHNSLSRLPPLQNSSHHKMKFTAACIATLAASASALGINCRGSGFCPSDGAAGNLINLKAIVDNIQPRNRYYSTGQQIACTGSLCAFFQNGATGTAEQVMGYLKQLLDHGYCRMLPPFSCTTLFSHRCLLIGSVQVQEVRVLPDAARQRC